MAKLTRKIAKIFGVNSALDRMAVVGSLRAGSPAYSKDPAILQSLSNYEDGWPGIAIGNSSPPLEDMNGVQYVHSYQIAYLMQSGVPEWNIDTTYYKGSMVSSGNGQIFVSRTDDNLANPLFTTSAWAVFGGLQRTVTAAETATMADGYLRLNATGGAFTETLPSVTSLPLGHKLTLKNVSTNSNVATVKGTGAELIDGTNTIDLAGAPARDSITVMNNGTSWDII